MHEQPRYSFVIFAAGARDLLGFLFASAVFLGIYCLLCPPDPSGPLRSNKLALRAEAQHLYAGPTP